MRSCKSRIGGSTCPRMHDKIYKSTRRQIYDHAVVYGSAMASLCVEKFSTERLKELNDDMITDRMLRFVQLVNFDAQLGK